MPERISDGNVLPSTQKPVALIEYLIRTYTDEGDVVLDNCIGSGTTAVAAIVRDGTTSDLKSSRSTARLPSDGFGRNWNAGTRRKRKREK